MTEGRRRKSLSDTPLGLKPGGFSGLPLSYAKRDCSRFVGGAMAPTTGDLAIPRSVVLAVARRGVVPGAPLFQGGPKVFLDHGCCFTAGSSPANRRTANCQRTGDDGSKNVLLCLV